MTAGFSDVRKLAQTLAELKSLLTGVSDFNFIFAQTIRQPPSRVKLGCP